MNIHVNVIEAAVIKSALKDEKIVIVVPSPAAAAALREVYGVPEARIGILMSVWAVNDFRDDDTGLYMKMTRRQYKYYKRREQEILDDNQGKKRSGEKMAVEIPRMLDRPQEIEG